MKRTSFFKPLVFALLAWAGSAPSADFFWQGTNAGTLGNGASWVGGTAPGAGDNANFTNNTASFSATNAATSSFANFYYNGLTAGPTNRLVTATGAVAAATTALTVTNSFIVSKNAGTTNFVNFFHGALAVTNGAGTAQLIVGQSGVATKFFVNSANGGALVQADQIVVSQNATSSNSFMEASGGGNTAYVYATSLDIGQNAGAIGTFTVGTAGVLVLTNGAGGGLAVVGDSGKGTLAVSGTGRTVADQLVLGRNAGGFGTITISAGTITNGYPGSTATNLVVGFSGSGTFTQSGGTNSVANLAIVGLNSGATGAVNQTGGLWVLTNSSGSGTLVLGAQSGAIGSYTLNGASAAMVLDRLVLATNAGAGGAFTWTAGALTVNSLGANATSTSAILQSLVGTSLGSNSAQSISYGVTANLLFGGGLTLGQAAGGAGLLSAGAGSLAVTNATGDATLLVGGAGKGTFSLNGASLTVDSLVATNNLAGSYTNSLIVFSNGVLNTPRSSMVSVLGDLGIGVGGTTVWNMFGGTNVTVASGNIVLGTNVGGRALITVSGAGTLWSNSAGLYLDLGINDNSHGNQLVISNGGHVVSGNATIGGNGNTTSASVNSKSNLVLVADAGSAWDAGNVIVGTRGVSSANNLLAVSNGGYVHAASITVSFSGVCLSNGVMVTDAGSRLYVDGALNINDSVSSISVVNGGYVSNGTTTIGSSTTAISNSLVVAGAGSSWLINGLLSMNQGPCGNLSVTNGGLMVVGGNLQVGTTAARGTSNTVVVAGAGSRLLVPTNTLYSGFASLNNLILVSNGGFVSARAVAAGSGAFSLSNFNNTILVADGGILETTRMVNGNSASNQILNIGGVYQFTTNTPVITVGTGANNLISISNGTIAFAGITNADVRGSLGNNQLTNMAFLGNNTFRLNGASNWSANSQNYTFDSGVSPSNYVGLELINGNAAWRSAALAIGPGGTMLVSNAAAVVAGVTTNSGTVRVVNSSVTWLSNVVMSGGYVSDPSTNVFAGTLAVAPSGYLAGSNGDLFVFQKDFLNQSTNLGQFSLSRAAVLFTNSAAHLLSVSNSGSLNLGSGFTNFAQVATNFAIGQLSIASGNRLTLAGNRDTLTNALYVGWLDLQGAATNSFAAATNSIFLALNLPNINLYYDKYDARNDWLNAWLPSTGYDLWGGGLLLPIPEPNAVVLLGGGTLLLVTFLGRRKVA